MKIFLLTSLLLSSFSPLIAAPQRSGQASAEITIQHSSLPAGGETWVALHLVPDKGWHTYWKNPGEMGMTTSINWTLPKGIQISELSFPAPHTFTSSGITSLGYDGEVTLLAKLTASPDIAPGELTITGKASWLACTAEACLPGEIKSNLTLQITAADTAAVASPADTAIKHALSLLPLSQHDWKASCEKEDESIVLTVHPPKNTPFDADELSAFISTPNIIAIQNKQTWTNHDGTWVTKLPISDYFKSFPPTIELTLSGKSLPKPLLIVIKK